MDDRNLPAEGDGHDDVADVLAQFSADDLAHLAELARNRERTEAEQHTADLAERLWEKPALGVLVSEDKRARSSIPRRSKKRTLATLLDDLALFVGRYVAFPVPDGRDAVTLWAAHCHVVLAFESTPRLVLVSPEKQSGKTRTLETLELVTPAPRHAVNLTAAALFRAVAEDQPTLLFDEADTYFGAKAREHEELRGLVNAGHRKGACAYRVVGDPKNMKTVAFPAYCAVALAAIGDLPDTIIDRSVVIKMRRRAPFERVEPFRQRIAKAEGAPILDALSAWASRATSDLSEAWPKVPAGLTDRASDVWEPLLAIADMAGGHWPDTARAAAVRLDGDRVSADVSLGVRLLGDLRQLFARADRYATESVLEYLNNLDEAPWGNLRGKLLDSRGLARRLRRFDIRPTQVWIVDHNARGYRAEDMADAFERYLPPMPSSPTEALEALGPLGDEGRSSASSGPNASTGKADTDPAEQWWGDDPDGEQ